MDRLVPSGVRSHVPSGVCLSCHQACRWAASPTAARLCTGRNCPNEIHLTGSGSAPFRWTSDDRHVAAAALRGEGTTR
ncbi:MAG: hypothetical protein CVU21_14990 [Betaproteobacteria bacterium HGW-Betaproteobacteria-15]|nr:MAG: hypothetical protein CVU21_14990 [Betaproteobacteria bacterium HGW-Betaproteobacteria-15]